ncbi:methylmalonyl Co-A mutase-associated GTPase MeaB [Falsibacillus pallidus]|uniref:methylmalonyl Co-A mutase-associated GTPase MeaB n=1 Tax=Falsibacillus pallidus TaxID=493781 RepID=UPI003D96E096
MEESQKRPRFKKKTGVQPDVNALVNGVLAKERTSLAKAITLIESNSPNHHSFSQAMLKQLLPHTGNSVRIGITGVPGAGKSTFIESFGTMLCEMGHRVAVLAVDPSSTMTGGSILGDKTRMEKLVKHPNAFVRPSPSGGTLGGVHRKTRESIAACEAAGYDVILVETVGVGQSEVIVRGMVDFFMLLVLTGAGDELQGMKKGIMELADAIIVNKADGGNIKLAQKTKSEYNQILHFLQPATKGWTTRAYTCSALQYTGIEEIWDIIVSFMESTKKSGVFIGRRQSQAKEWLYSSIHDRLSQAFFQDERIKKTLPSILKQVTNEERTVSSALEYLFDEYKRP